MSLGLDLSNVPEQGVAIPDGSYNVIVEKAEVKPTKTGGELIAVALKVIDGPHAGRQLFENFNIKNANAQAVQIGLGQLRGMMRAFGHPNPNRLESTQELVGLKGNVRTKQRTDDYGTKAEVKGYGSLAGSAAPASGAQLGNGQAPAQGANPF